MCSLNHSTISILSKFPDIICSPVMTLRNTLQLKVFLKATQSSFYALVLQAPPSDLCSTGGATHLILRSEKCFGSLKETSHFLSFYFLIELCAKSAPADAQEVFLSEEGCLLPHVDSGDCKLDSFQPQNHEEPLAEGTVPHVLTIMSSLKNTVIKCFSFLISSNVLSWSVKQSRYLFSLLLKNR